MSNGAKVQYGINGKGSVYLGWGRGRIYFKKDLETGEINWWDPKASQDPTVSALLISRAQAIYRKDQDAD
jgi:hypothetical protein